VEKGFEKIILQFTTDFENALLFKGGWGGSDLPRELRAIAHIRRKGSIIILPRLDPFFGDGTSNLLIFLPLLN
jgi:hypothetical protein